MAESPQHFSLEMSSLAARSAGRQQIWFFALFFGWTLTLLLSGINDRQMLEQVRNRMALVQARALVEKDVVYRLWNSTHGGVYVPVGPNSQPNPYLDKENREVTTDTGLHLTLINPAYMTRLVHQLQKERYGIIAHITSSNPINPANKPDDWEREALVRIEQGEPEVSILREAENGGSTMRLMRPLVVSRECLQCHAQQGYKLGQIRGGISVDVPLAPYVQAMDQRRKGDLVAHLLIWSLGTAFLIIGFSWIRGLEKARGEMDAKARTLSRAVEQSPASVVLTDTDGNIVYVNPKFTSLTGYAFEEAMGQNPRILKSDRHPGEYYRELWDAITNGREWRGEFLNLKKNGDPYWEYASISPILNAQGEVVNYLAVKEDITARKKAEQELTRQKEFVEAVLNSIHDPISILSVPEGEILGANEAFRSQFGSGGLPVKGRSCRDIFSGWFDGCDHPDQCPILQTQRTGRKHISEHLIQAGDGEGRWVEISTYPLTDDEGQVTQVVHVNRDITDQKKAQAVMLEAKEQAEAASRAKSEFLANLSHEIRTPMNGVIGMTELTLATRLTSEQREYLELAKSSAESLLVLLNDILDFSKIEAGKLDLSPVPFNLRDCLETTIHSLAFKAFQNNVELVLNLDPEVPDFITGDPGRLRQVVLNLVGNAVKFTKNGEIFVQVGVESQNGDQIQLHFSVADTGIGIAPERQKDIFSEFTQADGSTTREFGGTGLGLAIAGKLVGLFGGAIWLESCLGQGSTFHFTAGFSIPQTPPVEQVPLSMDGLRGLKALVVDDNENTRRILKDLLRSWGLLPSEADGGFQALGLADRASQEGHPFDLVLVDAQMPVMDGFEVAGRLRSDSGIHARTPIIMLTSIGLPGDAERCRAAGIQGYLPKPVRQKELLAVIRAAMGESKDPMSDSERFLLTSHTVPSSGSAMKILLVEDNPVNQKLAQNLLLKLGHKIRVAVNGKEAVAAHQEEDFDMIFMDIQMPEMDGIEATAAIRRRERETGARVPIVAMTAYAMKGDKERFLEAGMDDYLAKPISAVKLFNVTDAIGKPCRPSDPEQTLDETAIDPQVLIGRVDGDLELLKEMIDIFLAELPERLSEIQIAAARDDVRGLEQAAHNLKGSIGYFSSGPAFESSRILVELARTGEMDQARTVCAALVQDLMQLRDALAAWRETAPDTVE